MRTEGHRCYPEFLLPGLRQVISPAVARRHSHRASELTNDDHQGALARTFTRLRGGELTVEHDLVLEEDLVHTEEPSLPTKRNDTLLAYRGKAMP